MFRPRRVIHDGCMEYRWIYLDDPSAKIHRCRKRRPVAFKDAPGLCSWDRRLNCADHRHTDRGINHRQSNLSLLRETARTVR